jgi:hypothetical protein
MGGYIAGPFLGNSSVNTFPQQQIKTQQLKSCVFYVVRDEMLWAKDKVRAYSFLSSWSVLYGSL